MVLNKETNSKYVLAIDLGTGGPKVALVADDGCIEQQQMQRVSMHLLPDGGVEQNPKDWWQCVKDAVKNILASSNIDKKQIIAISCTSQWSVITPIDENGEPLMNAVHWLDTRGGIYNRQVVAGFPRVRGYSLYKLWRWLSINGLAPTHSGVDSVGHMLFIKNAHPEIYRKTYKFLEPMDYLTFKLTGRITASQHSVIPMMMVDNRKWDCREYHAQLLKFTGIDSEKLPSLIGNAEIIGPIAANIAAEWNLPPTTPVLAGVNDTSCSVIGAGATGDCDGTIYIGTSLVLACHVSCKTTDILHMITTMPSPIAKRYLLMAEQGSGGKSLEFYLNNIVYAQDEFATGSMPDDAYSRLNQVAANAPPGSNGVLFLPWLNGCYAPDENAFARGSFFNLSLNTTRSDMTRAVLEGLAYNSKWTLAPAQKCIGGNFPLLRFAGGGALSSLWAQIHADILEIPIHQVADPTQVTIRGAAFLAFYKLRHRSLEELPGLVNVQRVFTPDDQAVSIYRKIYPQFCALYTKNKSIFAALNK